MQKPLDKFGSCDIIQKLCITQTEYGGIAQLGERLNGIQEVSGSIPLISTKEASKSSDFEAFSFVLAIFCIKKFRSKGAELFLFFCGTLLTHI